MSTMTNTIGIPEWTLGDRLGKALRESEIGIGEMAEYLDCSRNTIGNYVHENTRASKAVLRLWALRTGVPLEWLETGYAPGPNGTGGDSLPHLDSNQEPSGSQPNPAVKVIELFPVADRAAA